MEEKLLKIINHYGIDKQQEIWKDIKDYENLYQVSNYGNVKSKGRLVNTVYNSKRKIKGKILKQTIRRNGYCYVTLYNEYGKSTTQSIHRLVANHYIPNPHNYPIINHIDCNKKNNKVDNLEWCTQSHNIKEAYRLGREKPQLTNLGKFGKDNKKSKKIKQIDMNNNIINYYYGILEAERKTGINFRNIHSCLINKRKSAGGYKWELC